MMAVENAFIEKFGPYAGWAHNVLFISDLKSSKQYLPRHLQPETAKGRASKEKTVGLKTDVEFSGTEEGD